jgi:hypothetical protein
MMQAIAAAIDKKELPTMEPGAMCYMLSRQGYLSGNPGAGFNASSKVNFNPCP